MNWWERKWINVFDNGTDDKVVIMLHKLRVISSQDVKRFLHESSLMYSGLVSKQRKEEARDANRTREKQRQQRAPRSIKPTKTR